MNVDDILKILEVINGSIIRGRVVSDCAFILGSCGLIQFTVDFAGPDDVDSEECCMSTMYGSIDALYDDLNADAMEWWYCDEITEEGYPVKGLVDLDDSE